MALCGDEKLVYKDEKGAEINLPSWRNWLYAYASGAYAARLVGSTPTEGTHVILITS